MLLLTSLTLCNLQYKDLGHKLCQNIDFTVMIIILVCIKISKQRNHDFWKQWQQKALKTPKVSEPSPLVSVPWAKSAFSLCFGS
jgi:hypothetical protein